MQIETNFTALSSRETWLSQPEASTLPNQLELVNREGSLQARWEGGWGGRERGEKGGRGNEIKDLK